MNIPAVTVTGGFNIAGKIKSHFKQLTVTIMI